MPNYPEAYHNIAAAYRSIQQWDLAIAAAQEALKLKPDFQLANNNLAYSLLRLERGEKEVRLEALVRISREFGKSLEWLLTGND
ncbi:MAG: tetratricopeptide repeat protein [Candidatus Acidiferrales bacterium]